MLPLLGESKTPIPGIAILILSLGRCPVGPNHEWVPCGCDSGTKALGPAFGTLGSETVGEENPTAAHCRPRMETLLDKGFQRVVKGSFGFDWI